MFNYIFTTFLFVSALHSQAQNASDISGRWHTTDNEAVVEIYEEGGLYFGKIISLSQPMDKKGNPKKDNRNKDPRLKNRPLIGINTVYNLKYHPSEQKWQGLIYIPLTGMEVEAIITLKNRNTMLIKGYMGSLRKTQVWTRVKLN